MKKQFQTKKGFKLCMIAFISLFFIQSMSVSAYSDIHSNTFANATELELGKITHGFGDRYDYDYFKVTADKGGELKVKVAFKEWIDLGYTQTVKICLYNSNQQQIMCQQSYPWNQRSGVFYNMPSGGDYYVSITSGNRDRYLGDYIVQALVINYDSQLIDAEKDNRCIPLIYSNWGRYKDWIITEDCTLVHDAVAPANIVIKNGATLTIGTGVTLEFDEEKKAITLENGANIEYKDGAEIMKTESNFLDKADLVDAGDSFEDAQKLVNKPLDKAVHIVVSEIADVQDYQDDYYVIEFAKPGKIELYADNLLRSQGSNVPGYFYEEGKGEEIGKFYLNRSYYFKFDGTVMPGKKYYIKMAPTSFGSYSTPSQFALNIKYIPANIDYEIDKFDPIEIFWGGDDAGNEPIVAKKIELNHGLQGYTDYPNDVDVYQIEIAENGKLLTSKYELENYLLGYKTRTGKDVIIKDLVWIKKEDQNGNYQTVNKVRGEEYYQLSKGVYYIHVAIDSKRDNRKIGTYTLMPIFIPDSLKTITYDRTENSDEINLVEAQHLENKRKINYDPTKYYIGKYYLNEISIPKLKNSYFTNMYSYINNIDNNLDFNGDYVLENVNDVRLLANYYSNSYPYINRFTYIPICPKPGSSISCPYNIDVGPADEYGRFKGSYRFVDGYNEEFNYYSFEVPVKQYVRIETERTDTDTNGFLYNEQGQILAHDYTRGDKKHFKIIKQLEPGKYFVAVYGKAPDGIVDYILDVQGHYDYEDPSRSKDFDQPDDYGNTCTNAQSINLNSKVSGKLHDSSDVDVFQVTIPSENQTNKSLKVYALGLNDAKLQIRDINCSTILASTSEKFDEGITLKMDKYDLTYYIYVDNDSSRAKNYELYVDYGDGEITTNIDDGNTCAEATNLPEPGLYYRKFHDYNDVDIFKIDGIKDTNIDILLSHSDIANGPALKLLDASCNEMASESNYNNKDISYQFTDNGTVYVKVYSDPPRRGYYNIDIKVDDYSNEKENAKEITSVLPIAGKIDYKDDVDFFKYTIDKKGTLWLSLLDLDNSFVQITHDNVYNRTFEGDAFTAKELEMVYTGDYYIQVKTTDNSIGNYKVQIAFDSPQEEPPVVDDLVVEDPIEEPIELGDVSIGVQYAYYLKDNTDYEHLLASYSSNISQSASIIYPSRCGGYEDVFSGASFCKALEFGVKYGILSTNHKRFKPSNKINRAEFTKALVLAKKRDVDENLESNPFPDVPKTEWYAPYVSKVKDYGIVTGYDDGYFRPTNSITKPEAIKMVIHTISDNLFLFRDNQTCEYNQCINNSCFMNLVKNDDKDKWYAPYIGVALYYGLIDSSDIDPTREISRSEFMEMIYRAFDGKGGAEFKIDLNDCFNVSPQEQIFSCSDYLENGVGKVKVVRSFPLALHSIYLNDVLVDTIYNYGDSDDYEFYNDSDSSYMFTCDISKESMVKELCSSKYDLKYGLPCKREPIEDGKYFEFGGNYKHKTIIYTKGVRFESPVSDYNYYITSDDLYFEFNKRFSTYYRTTQSQCLEQRSIEDDKEYFIDGDAAWKNGICIPYGFKESMGMFFESLSGTIVYDDILGDGMYVYNPYTRKVYLIPQGKDKYNENSLRGKYISSNKIDDKYIPELLGYPISEVSPPVISSLGDFTTDSRVGVEQLFTNGGIYQSRRVGLMLGENDLDTELDVSNSSSTYVVFGSWYKEFQEKGGIKKVGFPLSDLKSAIDNNNSFEQEFEGRVAGDNKERERTLLYDAGRSLTLIFAQTLEIREVTLFTDVSALNAYKNFISLIGNGVSDTRTNRIKLCKMYNSLYYESLFLPKAVYAQVKCDLFPSSMSFYKEQKGYIDNQIKDLQEEIKVKKLTFDKLGKKLKAAADSAQTPEEFISYRGFLFADTLIVPTIDGTIVVGDKVITKVVLDTTEKARNDILELMFKNGLIIDNVLRDLILEDAAIIEKNMISKDIKLIQASAGKELETVLKRTIERNIIILKRKYKDVLVDVVRADNFFFERLKSGEIIDSNVRIILEHYFENVSFSSYFKKFAVKSDASVKEFDALVNLVNKISNYKIGTVITSDQAKALSISYIKNLKTIYEAGDILEGREYLKYILKKSDVGEIAVDSLDDYIKNYAGRANRTEAEELPIFDSKITSIENKFEKIYEGVDGISTDINAKSLKSISEKLGEGKDIKEIKDILRGTVYTDDLDSLARSIQTFEQRASDEGIKILTVKNRILDSLENPNLSLEGIFYYIEVDGEIFELQFKTKLHKFISEIEHEFMSLEKFKLRFYTDSEYITVDGVTDEGRELRDFANLLYEKAKLYDWENLYNKYLK